MRVLAALIVTLALAGCSDFGPDRGLVVQSTAPSFTTGAGASFVVTNRSSRTHAFQVCGPSGKVDRRSNFGWQEIDGFGNFCIALFGPLSLAPGQSHQFGISLRNSSVGMLRIRLTEGERILAVSNEFNVTS